MIEWLSKRYEILLQSLIKHGYLGKHILNDGLYVVHFKV